MNGRVIFFPLKHCPSEEKLRELAAIQERLHYYRVEFLNTIKRTSSYQRTMSNARYKNMVKESLYLVDEKVSR